MIDKKLLSEVLNKNIQEFEIKGNILSYVIVGDYDSWNTINIYELANMCKTWAYNFDEYVVESGLANGDAYVNVFGRYACSEDFPLFQSSKDTEPESIFAGCKWILEQKESK